MNAYLEEFPSDTEGQETAPLPSDEIMDITYPSMPTTWKNKIIEQGFNYANSTVKEMTDFFETRVENLEPKGKKKKASTAAKKTHKKSAKKRKREDSDSSVVESSQESSVEHRPNRKHCILHGKCSHSADNCKELRAMVKKQK